MTWFRLGGTARWLYRPHDVADLSAFCARARSESVPWKILGCGANVLVRDDGFDGVVIRLDQPAFRDVHWCDDGVEVGAGVELMPLAKKCAAMGYSGLEAMAGIPATIGGAVRMNAGGRFGDFGSAVREIRVLDRGGSIQTWNQERIGFGYRHSDIEDRVVLWARLELRPDDPDKTQAMFTDFFEQKKATQPLADHSAGCIFKNPPGASAGAMIDRAGLKGTASGRAKVSERHANFIVADRGATSSDVLRLIDIVRERVFDAYGTRLETEIDIW